MNSGPLPYQGSALPSCATRPMNSPSELDLRVLGTTGKYGGETGRDKPVIRPVSVEVDETSNKVPDLFLGLK